LIKRNAVILGLLLIAATIASQLGYTIFRDHRFDQERQREVDAARNAARLADGHKAWTTAVLHLDSAFQTWITERKLNTQNTSSYFYLEWVYIKIYEHAAVKWTDDRTVLITGYIAGTSHDGQRFDWTKWTRTMWRMDDGDWGYPDSPTFEAALISPAQRANWLTQTIKAPER
jgi:hypothetical protein